MSVLLHSEPECTATDALSVELAIEARHRVLGADFTVRRVLPSIARRMVGPFVFFDHMGPVALPPREGFDVPPHPHIHLATVTYLFEGEILHRDSLGSEQRITPGAVNWMMAGRGIVHSERSPLTARASGPRVHGIQLWAALPSSHEEDLPSFQHHPAASIPEHEGRGVRLRVIAGSAFGVTSPVGVVSELFYVDAALEAGASLEIPSELGERAAYVVTGSVRCDGVPRGPGTMLVFRSARDACISALEPSRLMLLGGAPLDGPRFIDWNFVSSSKERIAEAKRAWRERRFPTVPGDEIAYVPLPEDRS